MSSPYRESSGAAPTQFCFYCGGAARGTACTRCGLFVPPCVEPSGTPSCPRCEVPLALESLGTARPWGCPKCRGCFVTRTSWDALLSGAAGKEHPEVKDVVPLPPGKPLTAEVLFRAAKCPSCRAPMERVTFAATSKTVIDVCSIHGIWFDAVELVAVLAVLTRRVEGVDSIAPDVMTPEEKELELERMRAISYDAIARAERVIEEQRQRQDDFNSDF